MSAAIDLLKRMADVYATCRSYRDVGSVTSRSVRGETRSTDMLHFSTRLIRPERFRFEYRNRPVGNRQEQLAIWLDGGRTCWWWSVPTNHEPPTSLCLAIAGATGVSGRSAHLVPRLLLPEHVTGWCLTGLHGAAIGPDAEVVGHRCCVVEGRNSQDGREVVYLDAHTLLLRRVWTPPHRREVDPERMLEDLREIMPKADFDRLQQHYRETPSWCVDVEHTIDYDPELDVEIADSELTFAPPADDLGQSG